MCAEFTPGPPLEVLKLFEGLTTILPLIQDGPLKRVYPHGRGPFLRCREDGALVLTEGEFGLIPSWWKIEMNHGRSKTKRPLFATYNARLETIREKKSFRIPFRSKHCVVPMRSFFESSYFGDIYAGHRIEVSTDHLLLAAGIFDEWVDADTGEVIPSFSIITHHPPEKVFHYGHDRCPVLLTPEAATLWLKKSGSELAWEKFCLDWNQAALIPFHAQVDRPLAKGWEKRAPSNEEVRQITVLAKANRE